MSIEVTTILEVWCNRCGAALECVRPWGAKANEVSVIPCDCGQAKQEEEKK